MIRFQHCVLFVCLASAALAQAPPRLAAPAEGSELAASRMLQWDAVTEAASYDVVVCGDFRCGNVVTRAIGIKRTEWKVPAIPAGTYYWRVIPVAANDVRLPASVTGSFTIAPYLSGHVYEDVDGDGTHLQGRPDVRVTLYRDGNDAPVATATTAADGSYLFHPGNAGGWWVAVDSKTVTPLAGAAANAPISAEQTFGPAGSQCATMDGKMVQRSTAGACYGGAAIAGPAVTRAKIAYDGRWKADADFGFSFNVVTNLTDADPAPRGSLRQFVINANAIRGMNPMRFVPAVPATTTIRTHGEDKSWWTIRLQSPLPALTDDGTTIDGLAHDLTATLVAAGRDRRDTADIDPNRVDLEIVTPATLRLASKSALHSVAVSGASPLIATTADAKVDHLVAGALPNLDPLTIGSENVVVVESGTLTMTHSFVSGGSKSGIDVRPGTKLMATDVEVTACGTKEHAAGSGIHLASNEALLTRLFAHNNLGAGVQIDGVRNRIEQSRLSDNAFGVLLGPNAADNVIITSELVWNAGGAVVADTTAAAQPARNRVSQNYFNENGGVPIQLVDPQKEAQMAQAPCNGRLLPVPKIESVDLRGSAETNDRRMEVHGNACPGAAVELYTSYVTGELREHVREGHGRDLPSIREALNRQSSVESRDAQTSDRLLLPSVGEFHFAAATQAKADGTFDAVIPLGAEFRLFDRISADDAAARRLYGHVSVAAITIDPSGATSEFSPRKLVH